MFHHFDPETGKCRDCGMDRKVLTEAVEALGLLVLGVLMFVFAIGMLIKLLPLL